MAKDGPFIRYCAAGICLTGFLVSAIVAGDEERGDSVATALAVQTALRQGREALQRNEARNAVFALESQLSRINGNPTYLATLRDAYRLYVKELRLANQEAEAQRYQQRLQILDPGAALDANQPRPPTAAALAAATPPVKSAPATPTAAPAPAKAAPPLATKAPVTLIQARGVREDVPDDPFRPTPAELKHKAAASFLARAEQEFANRHYLEAGALFEQANLAEPKIADAAQERWAYCKLFRVYDQINKPECKGQVLADAEKDIRLAIAMAPRLQSTQHVKNLLEEIDKRKNPVSTQPVVTVRHYERQPDGWARAETANFRIFHNQSRELAEQVCQIAERTRTEMSRKWLGNVSEEWKPRCDIFLHASAQDYSRETHVSADSPGHSSFQSEGGRIISRRIDLHCTNAQNMVNAVLPHETTHVVLSGQFGEQPIPRWADEGMAVLTEPHEKIEPHFRNLLKCRQENTLFSCRQIMQLNDYPDPRRIPAFYAESVSLVQYLSTQNGPLVFSQFLRDAQKDGYEQALQKHYGYRSFDELQQQWTLKAFTTETSSSGVARVLPGSN